MNYKGENMKDIKIGDKVKWDSYKEYRIIVRMGTVIAIVPKGESANKYIPPLLKRHILSLTTISVLSTVF